jgi:hypothetical protein
MGYQHGPIVAESDSSPRRANSHIEQFDADCATLAKQGVKSIFGPESTTSIDHRQELASGAMSSRAASRKESVSPERALRPDAGGGLAGLGALIERAKAEQQGKMKRGLPPVERWNPPFCGDLDIVIKRDGTWFYLGTPIGRMPIVRLFSTVLRKDKDGRTYLVTPVEKIGITVEDAPFIAVEMNASERGAEQVITFRTNVGDLVEAGPDHPIRFVTAPGNDGIKPYVRVRGRLDALLARPVMYELIGHGEEIMIDGRAMFAVRSAGAVFAIMPADELARRVAQ